MHSFSVVPCPTFRGGSEVMEDDLSRTQIRMACDSSSPPTKERAAASVVVAESTGNSKRKWNPSTWRYAIEEVQPELGSKPRRDSYLFSAGYGHRDRDRERERDREKASFYVREPPRRPASPDKADASQHPTGTNQIPTNQSPSRQLLERNAILKTQGQTQVDDVNGGSKKNGIHKKSVHKDGEDLDEQVRRRRKKESLRRRAENRHRYAEKCSKRRKREMTPSEFYFCEICSRKAANDGGSPVEC